MDYGKDVFVVDADVLVDFAEADPTILGLHSRHQGQIQILAPILDEVDQLDEAKCEQLGLRVVAVDTEILLEAGELRRGGLSFPDRICLLVAKESGACCITNDTALRRECMREGVACVWGLELMIPLVAGGHLSASDAFQVAEKIHEGNPRYITRELLERFEKRIGSIGKEP